MTSTLLRHLDAEGWAWHFVEISPSTQAVMCLAVLVHSHELVTGARERRQSTGAAKQMSGLDSQQRACRMGLSFHFQVPCPQICTCVSCLNSLASVAPRLSCAIAPSTPWKRSEASQVWTGTAQAGMKLRKMSAVTSGLARQESGRGAAAGPPGSALSPVGLIQLSPSC